MEDLCDVYGDEVPRKRSKRGHKMSHLAAADTEPYYDGDGVGSDESDYYEEDDEDLKAEGLSSVNIQEIKRLRAKLKVQRRKPRQEVIKNEEVTKENNQRDSTNSGSAAGDYNLRRPPPKKERIDPRSLLSTEQLQNLRQMIADNRAKHDKLIPKTSGTAPKMQA